jgi:hypothetical protein
LCWRGTHGRSPLEIGAWLVVRPFYLINIGSRDVLIDKPVGCLTETVLGPLRHCPVLGNRVIDLSKPRKTVLRA